MKSTAVLVTSMLLLSGCASGPEAVRLVCPPLPPPPDAVLEALAIAAHNDPSVGAWIIDLDDHYAKLDACRA